ncbi:type IV pilin N-terminal domain-containing protein [Methanofollis fontis]|nr:type IV pilin N-terminal domain-containing protein [Methanofollis fontis]
MDRIYEEGVSEVIGAVLLISLVVLGVAIVAVTILSQPPPAEVPRVSVVAATSTDNTTFVLFHEGGDTLSEGEYRIYVDNGSGLEDRTDEFTLSGDGIWSIGENLTYTGDVAQIERVVVSVVDSSGGEMVIAEPRYAAAAVDAGGFVDEGGAGTWPVVTVTPEGGENETSSEMIVGPDVVNNYVIDASKDFTFSVNISTPSAHYVHMAIYNYNDLKESNKGELSSHIIALNLTQSEAEAFYYNHTLKTTENLGADGDLISVTAIVYDINNSVIAYQSVLGTLDT